MKTLQNSIISEVQTRTANDKLGSSDKEVGKDSFKILS
jgi:hypothetical protein